MKFSFSTLACPDYTWADIYSMAKDLGFDGIEVRGLGNDIFDASKNMPFSPRLLPATRQKLASLRLTIPCLSSAAACATARPMKRWRRCAHTSKRPRASARLMFVCSAT